MSTPVEVPNEKYSVLSGVLTATSGSAFSVYMIYIMATTTAVALPIIGIMMGAALVVWGLYELFSENGEVPVQVEMASLKKMGAIESQSPNKVPPISLSFQKLHREFAPEVG